MVVPTGGNPGARYLTDIVDNNSASGSVRVAHVKNDYSSSANINGDSFTLSFDRLEGPMGTNPLQGYGVIVKQGASVWYRDLIAFFANSTWTTTSASSSFNAANFVLMTGSGTPNFSGGVETNFGLFTFINQGSTHYAAYYDNWTISSPDLLPPPEIAVTGNATDIVDGDATPSTADNTDFGLRPVGSLASLQFVLVNSGGQVLTLGTPTFTGPFSLDGAFPTSINPGDDATFSILFDTSALGAFTGSISFATNDGDENPFNFSLAGETPEPGATAVLGLVLSWTITRRRRP